MALDGRADPGFDRISEKVVDRFRECRYFWLEQRFLGEAGSWVEQHLLTAPLFGLAQLFLGEIGFLGGAAFLAGAALSGWSRVLGGAALLAGAALFGWSTFWVEQRFSAA